MRVMKDFFSSTCLLEGWQLFACLELMIQILELTRENNFLRIFNKHFMATGVAVGRSPKLLNFKIEVVWVRQNVLVCHACDFAECS